MSHYLAFLAISGVAAALGVALALRERAHRPIAALLAGGLALDVVQELVRPLYADAARPFTGAERWWAHAGQAAFAAYPWAVLMVAALVLGRRRAWPVGVAWATYELFLVIGYQPLDLRGARLGFVYLTAQALLVAAMVVIAVPWWRTWRASRRERDVHAEEVLAFSACAIEAIILAGPFLSGTPWESWSRQARPPYALFYLISIVMEARELWISLRSSRRSRSA